MKLLVRYILKELLVPLGVWLAFLFLLLFVMQFLRTTEVLLGSAVTARDVGRLMVLLAPHFLVMAVPVAFLMAILLGLGRLGDDREIAALSALGIGPLQIAVVPVAIGAVLGLATLGLAVSAEPYGLREVKGLVNEIIKKNIVGEVKPGIFYEDLTHLTVYAENVDKERGEWRNVLIHDDREPTSPLLVLAREGRVNAAGRGAWLKIALDDGRVHRANRATTDYSVIDFERAAINVGVEGRIVGKNRFRSPREEMTPGELWESAEAAQKNHGDPKPFLVAFYSRFALALTPMSFGLLGTPLALSGRRGGRARGLLITILAYVGYYVLARLSENLAIQGHLPIPVAVLAPSAAIALVGGFFLYRIARTGVRR
ncbi:MAG: LptF/LptG family permease [Myxococcaceae bacterium]|nr:LptF/LptG family permease [Myxococcaceae bacterium]